MLVTMLVFDTILLYHSHCMWLHLNSRYLVTGTLYHYYFLNKVQYLHICLFTYKHFEQNTKELGVLLVIMKLYE